MIIDNWTIKIIDPGYTNDKHVFIFRHVGSEMVEVFRDGNTETIKVGEAAKPSFIMSPEMLQEFADALDRNGIKPQKGFLEGKIEATEKHLEDMRKLVFK